MTSQTIARNKKAWHDYEILDEYEAGIALQGTEVKALREHRVNLKESYAKIRKGEVWLEGCHISPYSHAFHGNHDPLRSRKLLLHRREIRKLIGKVTQKGLTLVPLSLYFRKGKVKLKLAVARGKRAYDKRETKRRRDIDREVRKELKRSLR